MSKLIDLPQSLAGTKHPFPVDKLHIGTTFQLRFNEQTIRRGVVLYDPSSTPSWVFYPGSFSTKIVRGELPCGHQLLEGISEGRLPTLKSIFWVQMFSMHSSAQYLSRSVPTSDAAKRKASIQRRHFPSQRLLLPLLKMASLQCHAPRR